MSERGDGVGEEARGTREDASGGVSDGDGRRNSALLAEARRLLTIAGDGASDIAGDGDGNGDRDRPSAGDGVWTRAAALLTRQSLEAELARLWRARAPGAERASMRAQLLCLPAYLGGGDLAGRVAWAYQALSAACHLHSYDLAPTAAEVCRWIDVVEEAAGHVPPTPPAAGSSPGDGAAAAR